ncbi:MAG: SGNH/GDSL hydrolase family protein [Candidatus Fermentibacteraceae bacterium]
MDDSRRLSDNAVSALRLASAVAGAALCLAGLFGRFLGLGSGSSFNLNQGLVVLSGLILVLAGVLGRRFSGAYRALSVILLNMLMVLLVIELASFGVMKAFIAFGNDASPGTVSSRGVELPDRSSEPPNRYEPYLLWKTVPDLPPPESSDSLGRRMTTGSSPDPGALSIHVFGSSLVWGLGVPDSSTIPSLMASILGETFQRPVRIVNHGVVGWVSTQEVIHLMLLLRDGLRPDIVVFINGFNDVVSAYQSGVPGAHYKLFIIGARVEGRAGQAPAPSIIEQLIWGTNTADLALALGYDRPVRTEVTEREGSEATTAQAGILAAETAALYARNLDLATRLSEAYGFQCYFLLQPAIWAGDKPLTEHELQVEAGGFPGYPDGSDTFYTELFTSAYGSMDSIMGSRDNALSLVGAFDTVTATLFQSPSGCHVTSEANRILAEAVCSLIMPELPDRLAER